MAQLTKQSLDVAGVTPSYAACAGGGDAVKTSQKPLFLHVKNGSGGSLTVTVTAQQSCDQGSSHNIAVAVGAGAEKMIRIDPPGRYTNSSGNAVITYSGVTSLTIGAFELT